MDIKAGFQKFAASTPAVLNGVSVPVIVYAVNVAADGSGGEVDLCDGVDDTTVVIGILGDANTGFIVSYPDGIVFPNGCYVNNDAHITATVIYQTL